MALRATFASLLGHFNSFWVSVDLGARPLPKARGLKGHLWTLKMEFPAFPSCHTILRNAPSLAEALAAKGSSFSGISKPVVSGTRGLHPGFSWFPSFPWFP